MKKTLLMLIPALMALSACGGANPEENNDIFLEDTLAHDEVFGNNPSGFSFKSIRNLDPVDGDLSSPRMGIQTHTADGKISVRFVAAVKLANETVPVSWTRSVFEDDGDLDSGKGTVTRLCAYKYASIYDGGDEPVAASTFGDYNYFVTYTIRNIPLSTYGNYYLNATLSINGTPIEKVVSTTVNQNKQVSYSTMHNTVDYLIAGTINGYSNVTLPQDGETPAGNKARFTQTLAANDSFFVLYNHVDTETPANSKFKIYDSSILTGSDHANTFFVNDGGKIKASTANNYVLYLDNSDIFQAEVHTTGIEIQHGGVACSSADLYLNLDGDETFSLSAITTPATVTDAVTWTSSDTSVATVSSAGLVTRGSTEGTTTITATSNGQTDTCTINVREKGYYVSYLDKNDQPVVLKMTRISDYESKPQYEAVISPKTGSTLTFNENHRAITYTKDGDCNLSGANLVVGTGGPDLHLYLKHSEDATSPLYVTYPDYYLYAGDVITEYKCYKPQDYTSDKAVFLIKVTSSTTYEIKYGFDSVAPQKKTISESGMYLIGINSSYQYFANKLDAEDSYVKASWNGWAEATVENSIMTFTHNGYFERSFTVSAGSQFKVVYNGSWYGETGTSAGNVSLDEAGTYAIRFYPAKTWDGNYIVCVKTA